MWGAPAPGGVWALGVLTVEWVEGMGRGTEAVEHPGSGSDEVTLSLLVAICLSRVGWEEGTERREDEALAQGQSGGGESGEQVPWLYRPLFGDHISLSPLREL